MRRNQTECMLLYAVLTLAVAVLVFYLTTLVGSLPLIARVLGNASGLSQNLVFVAEVLRTPFLELATTEIAHLMALSLLIGLNVSLLIYYVRSRRTLPRTATTGSVLGLLVGILGTGCAACGSLILGSAFLSITGYSLHALPYHGAEIGYMSLALLALSSVLLVRAIRRPHVCAVPIP